MSSRSFRLETRSRARDEIKRIMQTVEKVRKWEKKWIDLGLSNSLKVYKWVPVRDENKDDDSDDDNKENEPVEVTEAQMAQNGNGERDLPDIKLQVVEQPMNVDSSSIIASQAPPEMLFGSEDGEKKTSPNQTVSEETPVDTSGATAQSDEVTEKGDGGEGVVKEESSIKEEESLPSETPPTSAGEAKPSATGTTSEASKSEDMETESMETDVPNDGGDKTSDDPSSLQQPAPASIEGTSSTVEQDANGNTVSQGSEVAAEEQSSSEPVKDNESQSSEKVRCQSETSEATAKGDDEPAEKEAGDSQREGDKADDGGNEADKETVVESQDDEKRGEKRSRETSLERKSSTPSPKRSRSKSPH